MIVNAPSHSIRPPKFTPSWFPRPDAVLSGDRLTLPLVTIVPSGLATCPVMRAICTSCIPKLTSSTSWLRPTVIGLASFTDGTPG